MISPYDVEKTLAQIEKLIRQVRVALREQDQATSAPVLCQQSVSAIPDWP